MKLTFEDAAPLFLVYDVPATITFYRDSLGFEVTTHFQAVRRPRDNYGWAMLRRDDYVESLGPSISVDSSSGIC